MQTFKKGDTVKVVSYPVDDGSSPVEQTGKIVDLDDSGYIRVDLPGPRKLFRPEELELAKDELSWENVEAGDVVTIRVRTTGQEITAVATTDNKTTRVLGLGLNTASPAAAWKLLKIEKPKPLPPTTPGSLVRPNGRDFVLFLRTSFYWVTPSGTGWNMSDLQEEGFEVIYDAKDHT